MLLIPTITTLLATLAAAAPSKRQSGPGLSLTLTNTILNVTETFILNVTETFNVSTVAEVFVDSTVTFDSARLECRTTKGCIAIPEFHCLLKDKSRAPAARIRFDDRKITPPIRVGSVVCGWGRLETVEPQAAAPAEAGSAEP